MEKAFLEDKMVKNPFQDPMGDDAHEGLSNFLQKFHQPTIPSHTIITDPEYYVFLWFHNANGQLIDCPYTDPEYTTPVLVESSVDYGKVNKSFCDPNEFNNIGIQPTHGDSRKLAKHCFDLTPFVREATLPEIAPAGAEKITTLFGETTAGAFSPYASDGSKSITLNMLDTEYSILDAIFYPWMKDINSPWWYKPDAAFTEWATPYPMATLEVQRPRMRYRELNGGLEMNESRNQSDYTYYSYKFLGVKPQSYAAFQVNGAGVSNLLRSLTLVADMCLVDLTSDAAGSTSSSTNLGVRTKLFTDTPIVPASEEDDTDNTESEKEADELEEKIQDALADMGMAQEEMDQNENDIEQQEEGDMPGEDEEEWEDQRDPSEYSDEFSDEPDDHDNDEMGDDTDQEPDWEEIQKAKDDEFRDQQETWEGNNDTPVDGDVDGSSYDEAQDSPANEIANDVNLEMLAENAGNDAPGGEQEKGFAEKVMDGLMDVGSAVADGAKTAAGWTADALDAGMGLATDVAQGAVGAAVDVASAGVGLATDAASGALGVAGQVAQSALGAAGSLAGTALGAAGSLAGGVLGSATDLAGNVLGGAGTAASTALGAVGNIASGLLGGVGSMFGGGGSGHQSSGQSSGGLFSSLGSALGNVLSTAGNTAFGVVQNVASAAGIGKTSPTTSLLGGVLNGALSGASSLAGGMVAQAGNVLGGVMKKMGGGTTSATQAAGVMRQNLDVTDQVRKTGVLTTALNAATGTISSTMGLVGNVASSVMKVAGQTASSSLGGMAGLMKRMTTLSGNTPTPVESYIGMVTKQNAMGQSQDAIA